MQDEAGLKVAVSIRISLRLRARLTKAAYSQGRSINAEIARRLEASFPAELEEHERRPSSETVHGP